MTDITPDTAASKTADDAIALAGDITIAWLQNPNVHPTAQDVPNFLKSLHSAIVELGGEVLPEPALVTHEPAVSVRSSVKADHLVSLIDGKKYKTLKRHLATNGLTPDEYRARYGLKSDYPMVAESYAKQRREIAKKLGLGRKPAAAPDGQVDAAQPLDAGTTSVPAKPRRTARASKPEMVSAPVATPVLEPDAPAAAVAKPKRAGRKAKTAVPSDVVAPVAELVAGPVSAPVIASGIAPAADTAKRARKPKAVAQGDATTAASAPTASSGKAKRDASKPKTSTVADKVAKKPSGKPSAKPAPEPAAKPPRWVRPEIAADAVGAPGTSDS